MDGHCEGCPGVGAGSSPTKASRCSGYVQVRTAWSCLAPAAVVAGQVAVAGLFQAATARASWNRHPAPAEWWVTTAPLEAHLWS
ncbi:MAG: hypothetical protein HXL00_01175 [Candidatus Nanosynbacter sp.]|nr:hypothetical protein [Candidatus Nanosynbacter sp.]